jgi:hypothetical protein
MSLAGAKLGRGYRVQPCNAPLVRTLKEGPPRFRRVFFLAAGSTSNGASTKGFSKSSDAQSSASSASSASARLNKLRENSAALRELLQKRAEGVSVAGANGNGNGNGKASNGLSMASRATANGGSALESSQSFATTTTAPRAMVPVTFYMKFHAGAGELGVGRRHLPGLVGG